MSSIDQATVVSLKAQSKIDSELGIKSKFVNDTTRAQRFTFDAPGYLLDLSKTHISEQLIETYTRFAEQMEFKQKRLALFNGSKINTSEERSVLHALLRDSSNQGIEMEESSALEHAKESKRQFLEQYAQIQQQLAQRSTPIKDIIHVGIGGSSLGTQLVFEALKQLNSSITIHFIGNIDAHQLMSTFAKCRAESTLVIGVSKTFTTAETLQNLDSIADWFSEHGVVEPLENFYGVTASPSKAIEYGISDTNVVSFPNWVGGRYSVWSSVSLSATLVIGFDKFEEFLNGAAQLDKHFYETKLSENICFLSAALDHYYGNFLGVKSRAIFAYDHRLRSLVDYLQQLETESNGKDRQRDGSMVDQQTSPVVWGGVGTDVQHSVFQMLHQGTSLIPSEFVLVKHADHELSEHHQELLANGIAQTAALLAGQDLATVEANHEGEDLSDLTKSAKIFSGDRPSTTILLDRLNPEALGALLAFYEHRTFSFGVLANINSYDQMGVELGKRLAKQVKPYVAGEASLDGATEAFDQSTANLLAQVLR